MSFRNKVDCGNHYITSHVHIDTKQVLNRGTGFGGHIATNRKMNKAQCRREREPPGSVGYYGELIGGVSEYASNR
jgi:hypothetical protein